MKNNEIQIIDPILSKIAKPLIPLISACLEYDNVYYKQDYSNSWVDAKGKKQFKKVKEEYRACMVDRRSGSVLTGFIPRLSAFAERKKIDIDVTSDIPYLKPECKPHIEGITFREDQIRQIEEATKQQRGIILAATGMGKTYLTGGFLSQYKKLNTLFLCHSIDILEQTKEKLLEFGFDNVNVVHGKSDDKIGKGINLVTIQTFAKFKKLEYADFFDIILIDEVQHCQSLTSQYGKVMQSLLAPIKIGFTATLPEGNIKKMTLEGLIGPVISEVSIHEGVDKGLLARPFVTLIPVKLDPRLVEIKKYPEIYEACIVTNKSRNRSIIKKAIENIKRGKTTLIIIEKIQHGHELMKIAGFFKEHADSFIFLSGVTETAIRMEAKKNLNNKNISVVIASVIWTEGISIETLNCILNAGGGKSEVRTRQIAGRALRLAKGKTEVEIVDMLDPYKYLSGHAIKRISIYVESGWL